MRRHRRSLLSAGAAAALCGNLPRVAHPQPGRSARIGYLTIQGGTALAVVTDSLKPFGWIHGQNLTVSVASAGTDIARLPELAASLVREGVELMVTDGNRATRAAIQASTTLPIVMQGVVDPVGQGLVASLRRPGGNVTGLGWDQSTEIAAKNLDLLRQIVPQMSRLACLIDPTVNGIAAYREVMESTAKRLDIQVSNYLAAPGADLEPAFDSMARDRCQALFVHGSYTMNLERVASLAARIAIPDMYAFRAGVTHGGLMSYGVNWLEWHSHVGGIIDRVLRGDSPAELPVQQPTRYELRISKRRATALGLTVPHAMLVSADEVIP